MFTVTEAVPPAAISAAVMRAVNWVLFTKVVVRIEPFQRTVDEDMKFDPLTVSVKVPPPAPALEGEREVRLGTGLLVTGVLPPPPPPPQAVTKTASISRGAANLPRAFFLSLAAFNKRISTLLQNSDARRIPKLARVNPPTRQSPGRCQ